MYIYFIKRSTGGAFSFENIICDGECVIENSKFRKIETN